MAAVRHVVAPPAVRTLVAVASSAGGVRALLALLPRLPADLPVPVVCVQHMAPGFPTHIAEILQNRCHLSVTMALGNQRPRGGSVLIAPPDRHVVVGADGRLHLSSAETSNHMRPSADMLFESAARWMGRGVVAVVLSGAGRDGAAGAEAVRAAGGFVLVQDAASAEFSGMPHAAAPFADTVVRLEDMAETLLAVVALRP